MTELHVELYGQAMGTLIEGRAGFDFRADPDAVERHGVGSSILSFAVPLTEHPRAGGLRLRRNFFDEILPEGRARDRLAGNAKIAPDYTIGMLARYGRDVAGAVKIWDPTAAGEPRTPATNPIDAARVRQLLEEVAVAPLGNSSLRRMSSLAGVQDKIVLAATAAGWAEPLDGFPSTHIIKPVVGRLPSLIFDEEFGSRIARHLGLAAFDSHIESFDGASALVIERYDRDPRSPDGRVHQEDFNQILGMSGDGKYQSEGHPGLAAIAAVLRRADRGAVSQLLKLTAMSLATGNLDMHAKNISMLHHLDGTSTLAPAYDVVPQLHLGFDETVALYINGKSTFGDITIDDLEAEGRAWGLRDARGIAESTIEQIALFVRDQAPHPGAHPELARDIGRLCASLLAGTGGAAASGTSPRSVSGGWGGPVA